MTGKTHMQRLIIPHSVCMQGIISFCEVFIMLSLNFGLVFSPVHRFSLQAGFEAPVTNKRGISDW